MTYFVFVTVQQSALFRELPILLKVDFIIIALAFEVLKKYLFTSTPKSSLCIF